MTVYFRTNTAGTLSARPAVLQRAARMPADGQVFTNDVGGIPVQIQMTGLRISMYAPGTRMWHTCCTNKDWAACLSQEMPTQTRVRSDMSGGEGVCALSHMDHRRKHQDSPTWSWCGHFKFHFGARALFIHHPSSFCSQKEEELFISRKCSLLISGYLMSKRWSEIVIGAFVASSCLWCLCNCTL